MRSYLFLSFVFSISLLSCSNQTAQIPQTSVKTVETKPTVPDTGQTSQTTFTIKGDQDSVIQNGENILRYKNGVIKMRGMMKNGKREGVWKSWYDDGTPWSETTFKAGIKNGKTTTWYENGKKRYEGFYTNDTESGKWIYWDEKGNVENSENYDKAH